MNLVNLIKETYPDAWAELQNIGVQPTPEGLPLFKIEREFSA
jgi:hypothetical protein